MKSQTSRFVSSLALTLTSIVVSLLIMEGALRIYNPIPTRVRGTTIVLPRNITYRTPNRNIPKLDPLIVNTRNSLGFRGPGRPPDYADRLTIITVGGSTTECFFLNDDKTWPFLLEKRLQAVIPAVWLNNAGLDGHSTVGHLALLNQIVAPLKPKVVLFLVGANDVGRESENNFDKYFMGHAYASGNSPRILFYRFSEHSELISLALNLFRAYRAQAQGLSHRELVLAQLPRVDGPSPEAIEMLKKEHAPYLAGYAGRIASLVEACRRNSIEPVLITQPALYGAGIDPTTGVDLGAVGIAFGINGMGHASLHPDGASNGRTEWMILEWYNDVTRRVGQAQNVKVIDLAREMPKDSQYYYDFFHYTNAGARKIAELVSTPMLQWLPGKWPGYVEAGSKEAPGGRGN